MTLYRVRIALTIVALFGVLLLGALEDIRL
jgi:hypothetical protein